MNTIVVGVSRLFFPTVLIGLKLMVYDLIFQFDSFHLVGINMEKAILSFTFINPFKLAFDS